MFKLTILEHKCQIERMKNPNYSKNLNYLSDNIDFPLCDLESGRDNPNSLPRRNQMIEPNFYIWKNILLELETSIGIDI